MEVPGRQGRNFPLLQSHSSEDAKVFCQPCQQENSSVPAYGYCQDCAEHLCKTCYHSHRKPAPCRNHVLLDRTQMPQSLSSNRVPTPVDLTERCEQHPGKLVEYFCQDHQVLGCSPCMTMEHRTCKIDYISEASGKFTNSLEYRKLLKSFETLYEHVKKIAEAAKENKKLIAQNEDKVKEEIKKFRKEINHTLDRWEAEVYSQVETMFSVEKCKADSLLKQSQQLAHDIETTQKGLEKLEKDGNINMLYIKCKRAEEPFNEHLSVEQEMRQRTQLKRVDFKPSVALKNLLQTEESLGNIIKQEEEQHSFEQQVVRMEVHGTRTSTQQTRTKPLSYMVSESSSGQISVMSKIDYGPCFISGITVIDTDTIAVADFSNKSIKTIDVKQGTIIYAGTLSSAPWDLTPLPGYRLAVSLPFEGLILILDIQDGLSIKSTLIVGMYCYGLVYSDGNLIVTYNNQTINTIKEINLSRNESEILYSNKLPSTLRYITCDGRRNLIYVSENDNPKIVCLNKEGVVAGRFVDDNVSSPQGLAVLEDGSILVCDSDNNNIRLISADLKDSRIFKEIQDKSFCPLSLALDNQTRKLYVCSDKSCRYIIVYKFKEI